ncbi:hypothetical protein HUU05_13100 [candidate division KSB1 bacterium]|nr:hypothetical protein [candidate division KSB1 bacterium]
MRQTYDEYERFVFTLPLRFLSIRYSTLVFQRLEPFTAIVRGEVFFGQDVRMRVLEVLDFDEQDNFIQKYSYEVYRGEEKLYWYDPFPHPHNAALAETEPHHKHTPPDIKHHRVPAPHMSFAQPNLPFLIQEIEALLAQG